MTTTIKKRYKLFTESSTVSQVILEEDKTTGKSKMAKFKALGIQTDAENKNGRYYPYQMMLPVVENYVRDRMKPGKYRSYGELGHPEGVEINLDRMSHYLQSLEWEGKDCWCIGQCMDTPNGRIADTILKEGNLELGVSTRGLGALDEETKLSRAPDADVVGEFNLVAIDIVADPSAPKGFIKGIYENRQYIIDDGSFTPIVEAYETLDKTLSNMPKKDVEKYLSECLIRFFKDLRK
jgi:hypothetical protein